MPDQITVHADPRSETGNGPNRRLRASGLIPAVVYGGDGGSRALSVSPGVVRGIVRSVRGVNTIFALAIGGEDQTETVMIHDYQLHPVDHAILHADFLRVNMEKEADWRVPVHLDGHAAGVKRGGHLDFVTRSLGVRCLPGDIPESIPLDVSDLDWGATVRAADLDLPERTVLASDPGVVVVHVAPPKTAVEDEAGEEEGGEAAEPADSADKGDKSGEAGS